MGVLGEKGAEKIFEEIIAENLTKFIEKHKSTHFGTLVTSK